MELVAHSTSGRTQQQRVRRSGGTVVEEKLLLLNISQSELGPRTRT